MKRATVKNELKGEQKQIVARAEPAKTKETAATVIEIHSKKNI